MYAYGKVAEWFKAAVLKTAEVKSLREFESHPFRHIFSGLASIGPAFFYCGKRLLQFRVMLCAIVVCCVSAGYAANVEAGTDSCARQEKELNDQQSSKCSGASYFFNPSGCFVARKALKAFKSGPCRSRSGTDRAVSEAPSSVTGATSMPPGRSPAPVAAVVPASELEQLKVENARLKAELERLRGQQDGICRSGKGD